MEKTELSAQLVTTELKCLFYHLKSVDCGRDDWIVDFYYPILSCFWKMISVSDPNPVLVKIILSVSKTYPKAYYDA